MRWQGDACQDQILRLSTWQVTEAITAARYHRSPSSAASERTPPCGTKDLAGDDVHADSLKIIIQLCGPWRQKG